MAMFLLSLLTCAMSLTPRPVQGKPLSPLEERRLPFVCAPLLGGTHLAFRDCINAIHLISPAPHGVNDVLSFGSGPNVDVQISNGDPLVWDYVTCEIHLQIQGRVPQLCSWQRVRAAAILVAHQCAIVNKAGWMHIDRLPQDFSAAAIAAGAGLQLWMGPRQIPVDDPGNNPIQQKTCLTNERKGTQKTSGISSQLSNFINAAKGRFGSGRTLLNDTTNGCFSSNNTNPYNLTGINGP